MRHNKQQGSSQAGHVLSSHALVLLVAVVGVPPLVSLGLSTSAVIEGASKATNTAASHAVKIRSAAHAGAASQAVRAATRVAEDLARPAEFDVFTSPSKLRNFVKQLAQADPEQRQAVFPDFHHALSDFGGEFERHALTVTRQLQAPEQRSVMLGWFARQQVDYQLYQEALAELASIDDQALRADVIKEIASTNPQTPVWAQLLDARRASDDPYQRKTIVELAEARAPDVIWPMLIEAANELESAYSRSQALIGLAAARGNDLELWRKAIVSTRGIEEAVERGPELEKVAAAGLPASLWPTFFNEIDRIPEAYRGYTLARLFGKQLPDAGFWEPFFKSVSKVEDPFAIALIYGRLGEVGEPIFWRKSLDAASRVEAPDKKTRLTLRAAMARNLPSDLRPLVLAAARQIEQPRDKIKALAALGARGEVSALEEALTTARALDDSRDIDMAISELARAKPPEAIWNALVDLATERLSVYTRARVLGTLAVGSLSEAGWNKLLDAVDSLEEPQVKQRLLKDLERKQVPSSLWDRVL